MNADQQTKDANVKAYVTDYFANHYIGKIKKSGKRGKAQFPVELWNVYDATLNSKMKIHFQNMHIQLKHVFYTTVISHTLKRIIGVKHNETT